MAGCDQLTSSQPMAKAPEGMDCEVSDQTDTEAAGHPQPLITVITPCLNAIATIAENLLSVLAAREALKRDGWLLEHLIIDGGSDDGTTELVAEYADRYSFCRWIANIRGGPYAAMNAGLEQASGHYTHVLNSDDLLLDSAGYAAFLQEGHRKGAKVLITSIGYFRRPDRQLKSLWLVNPVPMNTSEWKQQLLRGLHYPHPGFIAETELYRDEAFDEKYSLSADYKLMQKLLLGPARPETTLLYTQPLVAMAEGGATGSWRAILKGWKQLTAINQELGIQASSAKRYWKKARRRLLPLAEKIMIEKLEGCER